MARVHEKLKSTSAVATAPTPAPPAPDVIPVAVPFAVLRARSEAKRQRDLLEQMGIWDSSDEEEEAAALTVSSLHVQRPTAELISGKGRAILHTFTVPNSAAEAEHTVDQMSEGGQTALRKGEENGESGKISAAAECGLEILVRACLLRSPPERRARPTSKQGGHGYHSSKEQGYRKPLLRSAVAISVPRLRVYTDNENGTDKKHPEVKGDGAMSTASARREPGTSPTSSPPPTAGSTQQYELSTFEIEQSAEPADQGGLSRQHEAPDGKPSKGSPLLRARTKDVLYDEPYDETLSGGGKEKHPTNSTERHRPIREMEGVPAESFAPKIAMLGAGQVELASEPWEPGLTLGREDHTPCRRSFDLSEEIKSIVISPGPLLYRRHRQPQCLRQAFF